MMYRKWGRLPGSPPLPFTLGEDVVGRVEELGPGATTLEVGQRVAGATLALGVGGGYTEFVCLPESALVAVPAGIDAAEAVCVVVNYLTAYLHLLEYGEAKRGERALVQAAAGELSDVSGFNNFEEYKVMPTEFITKEIDKASPLVMNAGFKAALDYTGFSLGWIDKSG